MGVESFLLGVLAAMVFLPLGLGLYIFFQPIKYQAKRHFLSRSAKTEVDLREQLGSEETANWLNELLTPIYVLLMGRNHPWKGTGKNLVKDALMDFHKSSGTKVLADITISQIELGPALPVIRSVTPLKASSKDSLARFLFDLEYPGGLTWVVDGDLQTGIKIPVSLLVKAGPLRGRILVEVPCQADVYEDAKITFSFLEGLDLELSVEAMFAGRTLPHVGEAIAATFAHQFKVSTKWPNKKVLVNLGQLPSSPLTASGALTPVVTAPLLVPDSDVALSAEYSELGNTPENEIIDRHMSFHGELESVVDVGSMKQMVSLQIMGPLKNNPKVLSGSQRTNLKDFMKLVIFSFGIDPRDADRYELIARHGQSVVDMRKYTTLGKVQSFLDSHEGATLSLRRKSEHGKSDSVDRKEGRLDSENSRHEGLEEAKITNRKRSNSFS